MLLCFPFDLLPLLEDDVTDVQQTFVDALATCPMCLTFSNVTKLKEICIESFTIKNGV